MSVLEYPVKDMDGKTNGIPKVSVIVPFYNAEQYISTSLDSLIAQSLHEIEIILVDDGSTDNSAKCVETYSEKDGRIKILRQRNEGSASARNKGLAAAIGEYIGFLDSDDCVDPDFYKVLYRKAEETQADIVKGNGDITGVDGKVSPFRLKNSKIKENKLYFSYGFTLCIYKRNFLNGNAVVFPEDLLVGEDTYFLLYAVLSCTTMEFADDVFYHYMRRKNSLDSQLLSDEKVRSSMELLNKIVDLMNASRLDAVDYNMIYSGRVDYLLRNVFNRTNSLEMRAAIVSSAMKVWRKCREPLLYLKSDSHHARYFITGDEKGLLFALHRPYPRMQYVYLFGCVPILKIKRRHEKATFYLFNVIPLFTVRCKSKS